MSSLSHSAQIIPPVLRYILRRHHRVTTASFLIGLSLAGQPAFALNEFLYFRLTPSGAIEAVVTGDDAGGCAFRFLTPTRVDITSNSVTIVSPLFPLNPCIPPGPPYPRYEVVANLGALQAPVYNVTWRQGPDILSAMLTPSALLPQGIPTLGTELLLATAFLVAFFGMRGTRRNSRRAKDA